jgi:hypothetical protein
MQIAVIGLDLAKNVFQVHGIDDSGQAVLIALAPMRPPPRTVASSLLARSVRYHWASVVSIWRTLACVSFNRSTPGRRIARARSGRASTVLFDRGQLIDVAAALGRDDAGSGQMGARRIDQHGAPADRRIARPVRHRRRLPIDVTGMQRMRSCWP